MKQKFKRSMAIMLTCVGLNLHAACEVVEGDPFNEVNRAFFHFNHMMFSLYVRPATRVFNHLPLPVKESINNFIQNVKSVPYAINSLLQGKMADAGTNATRFVVNSTMGVFGLFDVAIEMGWHEKIQSLGNTLYAWGWKNSNYIVIPLIGPSTIRDGLGIAGDYVLSPAAYFPPDYWNPYYLTMLINTNYRAKDLQDLVSIAGVNDYDFVRSSYLQNRHYTLTGKTLDAGSGSDLNEPPE